MENYTSGSTKKLEKEKKEKKRKGRPQNRKHKERILSIESREDTRLLTIDETPSCTYFHVTCRPFRSDRWDDNYQCLI